MRAMFDALNQCAIVTSLSPARLQWTIICSTGAFTERILVADSSGGSERPQVVQGVVIRPQRSPGNATRMPKLRLVLKCKHVVCSAGALHSPALLQR